VSDVETETVVVGAGPAGLAVAACLGRMERPVEILERSHHVGDAWHRHYERLHLHTDKGHSALPYQAFPADFPRYPSRLQMIEYLENYARVHALSARFGANVVSARRDAQGWETTTQSGRFLSRNLVVASGRTAVPNVPTWPGQAAFEGEVLHSSAYRSGESYAGKSVLVVGIGNSGGEIAIDLVEHGARAAVSVRSPVNVLPRELLGMPTLAIAAPLRLLPPALADALSWPLIRAANGDITRLGFRKLPYGPMAQVGKGRIPLIDVGTLTLVREGKIAIRPGIERFARREVVFTDDASEHFDTVVLATGYQPRVDAFLLDGGGLLGEHGTPTSSGRPTDAPGLYFCGFYVSPIGVLREIAREARRIAGDIARR
jgi:cation diffusion facilitator CzcD-associated flavoprotein CzcO